MKTCKYLLTGLLLFITSCSDSNNTPEKLAGRILYAIQHKDAEKIISMQLPPEISARCGFYYYLTPDDYGPESITLNSPKNFYNYIIKRAEETKPERTNEVMRWFEHYNNEYDWSGATISDIKTELKGESVIVDILSQKKKKIVCEAFDLTATITLKNGEKLLLDAAVIRIEEQLWLNVATLGFKIRNESHSHHQKNFKDKIIESCLQVTQSHVNSI